MPFAVELYFDPDSEARVRDLWNSLVAHGARLERHNASRPHLSLAVCESLDVENTSELLVEFASRYKQFPLVFSAFGLFPGKKSTLYLAPKVTPALLAMQETFLSQFHDKAQGLWEHYLVERWNPHCTLTTRLTQDRFAPVFDVCRTFELPLTCTVTAIGIAALRPVNVRFSIPLRAAAEETAAS